MKRFLMMLALMLCFTSCATQKLSENTVSHQATYDSVYVEKTMQIDTVFFPADTVKIGVPITRLLHDTIIIQKGERSAVKLEVSNHRLTATGICDSLQKLVISTQEKINRLQSTKSSYTHNLSSERVKHIPWYYKTAFWLCLGLLILFLLGLLSKVLKKYINPLK